mmetsp:Transcript_39375/g.127417  ORF Transcript_39375/g.127417 Transcript_39375/m.127417 type:complete len:294 (+) Transcript_39375:60-941(+)
MLTSLDALGQKTAHPPSFLSTFLGCFIGLGGLAFGEVFLRELCSPAPATLNISASPPASPPSAGSPAPPPAYLYTADALPNATSIMSAETCDELGFWLSDHALLFVGSFGALATLLFAAPAAPLGKPKNTLGGHTLAVSTALAIASLELDPVLEKILTPSLAIALMLQFKVVHPPAAACSIIFSSAVKDKFKNPLYLFFPTLLGCTWMLLVQYLVARSVHSSKSAGPAPGPVASRTVTIAPPAPAASGPEKPAFKVPTKGEIEKLRADYSSRKQQPDLSTMTSLDSLKLTIHA